MRKNDRAVIKMGPARYDSDKATRSQIEDAKEEAKIEAYDAIVNNPDLDLAGGGVPTTGGVTPIQQPIGYIDPTFPIVSYNLDGTDDLGLPILGFREDFIVYNNTALSQSWTGFSDGLGYDISGDWGAGADLIYGCDDDMEGSINAYSRSALTNSSLFPNAATDVATYKGENVRHIMQSTPRAVTYSATGKQLFYREPGDISWTSESSVTGGTLGTVWAGDYLTGSVWGVKKVAGTSPTLDTVEVYRLLPSDGSIQSVGDMGVVPATSDVSFITVTAGNGYVTLMFRDGPNTNSLYKYYVKPANNTSNFTLCGTFTITSFNPGFSDSDVSPGLAQKMAVSANGETSYLYDFSGTLHMRIIDQTATIYDYDTGIPNYRSDTMRMHTHMASGKVAIVATVLTSDLGDSEINRITAALATYNYSTTVYQYYDITKYSPEEGQSGGTFKLFVPMSGLREVVPGEVRYVWGTTNGSNTTRNARYAEIVGVSGL